MNVATRHVKADGLVAGTATYTVKDDLSITPASSVSSIALLAQSGVKDLSALQERIVKIGKEEVAYLFIILLVSCFGTFKPVVFYCDFCIQMQVLEILLASLKSKTVLTDVFLQKKKVRCKKETAA